ISLRQSWPIAKLKFLFKALSLRYRDLKHDLNPSSTPIGLGLLHQHPPKKIHISRLEKAKNSGAYKISLVSPSLGQGMYIERTILSVLAQAYSKLEYIIQDGGSSDLTKEIVSSYTSIVTGFESAKDQGQSHAINIAFKKSTGDIMGWLNSDDMLAPGALDLVAHCFEKNPNIDVVYGNRIIIDSEDRIIGKWILPEHDNDVLLWADFIPQETMFWRRELWEKCGARIDEDFQFAMDWELILRFREAGARFKRIPAFLGYFRVHEEQKTTRDLKTRGAQEMNLLRKKYLGKIPSDEEVYLAIRPYLERHRVENFKYLWKEKFGMT
ncbi:MAG: glycosyltransferase family 2 protein, partial [Chlamydiota bacterium]